MAESNSQSLPRGISDRFYADLPPRGNFLKIISDVESFAPVPADWYLLTAHVVDSTTAVSEGRYKDVNLLAAGIIVALLNRSNKNELPFSFGGDGCNILIPPPLKFAAETTIRELKIYAERVFKLELRGLVIPLNDIRAAGHKIRVARFRVTNSYHQALFTGGGIKYAESLLHARRHDSAPSREGVRPNFTGLVCPWHRLQGAGQYVSLLVRSAHGGLVRQHEDYAHVLSRLRELLKREKIPNPVEPDKLHFTLRRRDLKSVVGLRGLTNNPARIFLMIQVSRIFIGIAKLTTRLRLKFGRLNFGAARRIVAGDTDYRKFDDMLRLTFFVPDQETLDRVDEFLRTESDAGRLVYGMSFNTGALLTCVINRGPWHLGLLDGADGGYARASSALQEQEREREREAANSGFENKQKN